MCLVKWGYVAGKHLYSCDIINHKEAVCQDLELQSEWGFLDEERGNGENREITVAKVPF